MPLNNWVKQVHDMSIDHCCGPGCGDIAVLQASSASLRGRLWWNIQLFGAHHPQACIKATWNRASRTQLESASSTNLRSSPSRWLKTRLEELNFHRALNGLQASRWFSILLFLKALGIRINTPVYFGLHQWGRNVRFCQSLPSVVTL